MAKDNKRSNEKVNKDKILEEKRDEKMRKNWRNLSTYQKKRRWDKLLRNTPCTKPIVDIGNGAMWGTSK